MHVRLLSVIDEGVSLAIETTVLVGTSGEDQTFSLTEEPRFSTD